MIDALLATRKHEITILSRSVSSKSAPRHGKLAADVLQEAAAENQSSDVAFRTVNYTDKDALVKALQGVHTVLSFIVVHQDPENKTQKNLIDAAVSAGVKRFAPSEWAGYVHLTPPIPSTSESFAELHITGQT